uniref:Uncharacterized protein n=1 Tax=Laticauda laticaudata TaxID=8630 RepID=A0A8C5SZB8_LATLA
MGRRQPQKDTVGGLLSSAQWGPSPADLSDSRSLDPNLHQAPEQTWRAPLSLVAPNLNLQKGAAHHSKSKKLAETVWVRHRMMRSALAWGTGRELMCLLLCVEVIFHLGVLLLSRPSLGLQSSHCLSLCFPSSDHLETVTLVGIILGSIPAIGVATGVVITLAKKMLGRYS